VRQKGHSPGGYLWSRYRNIYVLIAAHGIVNTLPLLLMR